VRQIEEMCCFIEREVSSITPRFFTTGDRGIEELFSSREVEVTVESLAFVPMRIASVLSLFSFSLFSVIQFWTSVTQSETVWRSSSVWSGEVLSYNCESSAKE